MAKSIPKPVKTQRNPNVAIAANTVMETRQVRRGLRVKASETEEFVKNEMSKGSAAMEKRLDTIRTLMVDAGVEFLEPVELKYVDPEARGGVEMGLNRLAYNPHAANEDLTAPWCGSGLEPATVLKMLDRKCKVQSWALRLKQATLSSLTKPNVEGMITSDGKPNKDLQQLLDQNKFERLPEEIETVHWGAVELVAERVLEHVAEAGSDLYSVNPETGKIILRRWTEDELRVQMKKAFKSSSPGFPYNRYKWDDVVNGQSVVSHALDAFEGLISYGSKHDGFIYFQQSRATGDGGGLYEESDSSFGQQRLVQAAPLCEKVIGHILAYPFKGYIKGPLLSGQNGIQMASRNLKALCQEIISAGDAGHFGVLDYDVSKWDVAQRDERIERGFFAVCDLVFDKEDEFTSRVLAVYKAMHQNRRLVTGVGQIRSTFLPSGSSITTVCAFINHEIQILVTNEYCRPFHNGDDLFWEVGLQGDDNISIVQDYTPEDGERIAYIYGLYGSTIKGGALAYSPLTDPDCHGIFLNEAIRVRDPIDEDKNAKFPRWSLFWAENKMDQSRGANMDRMLLDEIKSRVAHPTETELTFVSFVSKMDRFLEMGFHLSLLRWILRRSVFPMWSWLGERVCPSSPTLAVIRQIEEERGITWPSLEKRANDRREEVWADGDELADMLSIMWMLQEISPEAKEICQRVSKAGKGSSHGWKRSRKAMELAGINFEQNVEVKTSQAREFIKIAYTKGYLDIAQNRPEPIHPNVPVADRPDSFYEAAEEMGVTVDTPIVTMRSLMRGILSLNETNPWKLRYQVAKAIINAVASPGWNALHEETQRGIATWFTSQYGIPLISSDDPDVDADRLRAWINGHLLNEESSGVDISGGEEQGD